MITLDEYLEHLLAIKELTNDERVVRLCVAGHAAEILRRLRPEAALIINPVFSEWISVERRLPEDGRNVLTFNTWDECVYSANRHEGGWYHFCGSAGEQYRIRNVTHWMPTPDHPLPQKE